MRKILMAAMVLVAGGQGASAADMPSFPLRGGYSDLGVSRPIWDGFYIGGQASQSWLKTKDKTNVNADIQGLYSDRTGLTPGQILLPGSVEAQKAAFGGFVGWNSQWEDVVFGVEANYLHSDAATTAIATTRPLDPIQATSTLHVALKDYGSLRLRGGYTVGSFMPYAFVGFAGGSADVTRSAGATSNAGVPVTFPFETAQRKGLFVYGFSAGLGMDVMLIGGLFARAEYEYTQFSSRLNANVNTVKVGVGYKF